MKPVTQINFISLKPGKIGEFMETQQSYRASAKPPNGLIGSRIYRSMDGKSAVIVSQFESMEDHDKIHQIAALKQHIDKLRPLVESSSVGLYEEAQTTGELK